MTVVEFEKEVKNLKELQTKGVMSIEQRIGLWPNSPRRPVYEAALHDLKREDRQ